MSEKYIDLIDAIEDSDRMVGCERATVEAVLAWLDAHRDQVPGRTITESEWSEYVNSTNGKYLAGADLLEKAGITVVPDPELPTEPGSVVRMRKAHQWVRTVRGAWISTDGSVLDAAGAQEIADEHGFEVVA